MDFCNCSMCNWEGRHAYSLLLGPKVPYRSMRSILLIMLFTFSVSLCFCHLIYSALEMTCWSFLLAIYFYLYHLASIVSAFKRFLKIHKCISNKKTVKDKIAANFLESGITIDACDWQHIKKSWIFPRAWL